MAKASNKGFGISVGAIDYDFSNQNDRSKVNRSRLTSKDKDPLPLAPFDGDAHEPPYVLPSQFSHLSPRLQKIDTPPLFLLSKNDEPPW